MDQQVTFLMAFAAVTLCVAPALAEHPEHPAATPGADDQVKGLETMCEANADKLLPALDRALQALQRTRDSLRQHRSVAELVEAGHGARVRFESFGRPDIDNVAVGEGRWREVLAAAGRAGGVIRSALPGPGSRR